MSRQPIPQLYFPLSPLAQFQVLFLEAAIVTTLGAFIFTAFSFVSSARAAAVEIEVSTKQLIATEQPNENLPTNSTSAADLGEPVEAQLIIPVDFDCLDSITSPENRDICSVSGGSESPIPDGMIIPLNPQLQNPSSIDRFRESTVQPIDPPQQLTIPLITF